MRQAIAIELSQSDHAELQRRTRSQTMDARAVRRANIILLAAQGQSNHEIARRLAISRNQVLQWRRRFAAGGMAAIDGDRPRSGRPRSIDRQRVLQLTTQSRPEGATHWSSRTLAAELGVAASTVHRIWRAHGLKPHLQRTFKVSRDPQFAQKLEDVVALYMAPPEHALVLCLDEKSQIQALERTQPGLPMKRGRAGTMTHDYKRHGTTTLFAALSMLDGTVISQCQQRHTHVEWLKFLRQIDRQTPQGKQLHLICDNYATHKHAKVRAWLDKHPRFHMHFTPTSASWLNMVERFFRDLDCQRLKRAAFASVDELIAAIDEHIAHHNNNPKPFIWTAKAKDILQKVIRANQRIGSKNNATLH